MNIAITLGDPAGIGPEIILRCAPLIKKTPSTMIFGSAHIFKKVSQDLHLQTNYEIIRERIVNCTRTLHFKYGKPTQRTGQIALASIDHALRSKSDIIITPPIVKSVIQKCNPGFIGHTEYCARYYKIKNFAMLGIWRTKRIMLLSTHVPLRKVFSHITPKNISQKIQLLAWGLHTYFNVQDPSIAVSACNPHGYEFSRGEDESIHKGINQAKKRRIDVHGPFPADSLFDRTYDGFLAMYHDQAMIYLKSKKNGLNFTLGLPIIRLSPLYGAALDIAGKGMAEASGLETAIKTGILLFKNARRYEKTKID